MMVYHNLNGKVKQRDCGVRIESSVDRSVRIEVKVRMSYERSRGQTTPTSHPLDPEEEVPKRRFKGIKPSYVRSYFKVFYMS